MDMISELLAKSKKHTILNEFFFKAVDTLPFISHLIPSKRIDDEE